MYIKRNGNTLKISESIKMNYWDDTTEMYETEFINFNLSDAIRIFQQDVKKYTSTLPTKKPNLN